MSEPFLAEIRMVGFNFAPRGWALCDGQILPINQNQSLFSLLGTLYGGDGRTTFALPDLRGRSPLHHDRSTFFQGRRDGSETHTLTLPEIPIHSHALGGDSNPANRRNLADSSLAGVSQGYRNSLQQSGIFANGFESGENTLAIDPVQLQAGTVGNTGATQAHENMQPFLAVNFIIALTGIFPSRS